jgi:N-acetylmuramoyl-L-alanine amidase
MPIEPQVVVETNSNKTDIIYYIQIAASKKAMKVKSFNNLTGVIEKYYNGNYIYLIDKSFSEEQVKKNLSSVKNKGYKDAFIVAFIGEKRYSLKEIEAMGR